MTDVDGDHIARGIIAEINRRAEQAETPERRVRLLIEGVEVALLSTVPGAVQEQAGRLLAAAEDYERGTGGAKQRGWRQEALPMAVHAARFLSSRAYTEHFRSSRGERSTALWRFAVLQMLDAYRSVLRCDGAVAAGAMWETEPPATGHAGVDASFAALAEYLADRDGWAAPEWSNDPARVAEPPWYVTDLPRQRERADVESPEPFRRRGVFITADGLRRV
ncbi:hypothetical protein EV193_104336 [Herbihabitans rhizosphaerae]|uniref:Uncharacterized protein n=1 Tax=Herbihabitans rhizosphaerae TaxID=1872711 RepID=A0A4V2ESX8_9PSEU|nr:hypothetical protein [Herbihabitans rhizosphaerae]RZS39123.1 hypothetical protein EV193_104336 [Herbihabitans rhizosphaerae]